jgi:hypothetical protein
LGNDDNKRDLKRRMSLVKFKNIGKLSVMAYLISILLLPVFINSAYAVEWSRVYGGASDDYAYSVQQTADGGYILAGRTISFGSGKEDVWVIKLDVNGSLVWQKAYGGPENDHAYSVQQTADGGYILAGRTISFGSGKEDVWVIKLDVNGSLVWQKAYGGPQNDHAYSVQQTADGGYILAGRTASFGSGNYDILVLKLDLNGNVLWQKTYGGSGEDISRSIQQTADGGYILAGRTASFGSGNYDILILKLDVNGDAVWQKTYGGATYDYAISIQETSDSEYILCGGTDSFGAGLENIWILKVDINGDAVWQKTYGGLANDYALSLKQTADGGYIAGGYTESFGAGKGDFWILKLDSTGNTTWQKTYGGTGYEGANSVQQTADGGYIAGGYTESFGAGKGDFWILKLDGNGNINDCPAIGMNTTNATITNTSANPSSPSISVSNINMTAQSTGVSGSVPNPTTTTQCLNTGRVLTITKNGSGSGTVTSSPVGINCGSDCSESYDNGIPVTLTATPVAESTFAGWSGDSDCSDGSVTMTADKTCIATFNIMTANPTLTVTKNGTGSGTVTSTPEGINCGSDCSESYSNNTQVTLVAMSDVGSAFAGWSGDSDCSDGLVTLTADKTCTATFNISHYTLAVTKTGSGSGTVTSSPGGINCGSDCSENYLISTQVTLTAAPAAGSTFEGWSGCDSTNGTSCVVTIDGNKTVTANYGNIPCSPVYRFWSDVYLQHFYTISESEKSYVMATWPNIWRYEGPVFCAFTSETDGTSPVYRFWSDKYSQHFYTISEYERDYVIQTWPGIWIYEGPVFYAFAYHAEGTSPVDRFWSDIFLGHFYTISETEKIYVLETWPDVWLYEGTVFYAFTLE